MKLSDLKKQIADLEAEHGLEVLDLEVATTENHEYWGNVLNKASGIEVSVSQIDGPKRGSRKCLVIS